MKIRDFDPLALQLIFVMIRFRIQGFAPADELGDSCNSTGKSLKFQVIYTAT